MIALDFTDQSWDKQKNKQTFEAEEISQILLGEWIHEYWISRPVIGHFLFSDCNIFLLVNPTPVGGGRFPPPLPKNGNNYQK